MANPFFQDPPNYNTPGIGDGVNNTTPQSILDLIQRQPGLPQIDPSQIKGPSFFDKGGMGGKLLMGGIGGALDGVARYGGAQPGYANAMAQQQAQALEDQKYQRERKDGITDLILKAQIDAAYKQPEQPADAKLLNWFNGLDPTQRAQYAAMQDIRQPIAVSGPTGTFRVAREVQPQTMAATPQISAMRPQGATDDELLVQAQERIQRNPTQYNAVMEQLKAWGVGGQ